MTKPLAPPIIRQLLVGLSLTIVSTISAQVPLQEATPLARGRQMHGSVVLGDFLYVIGGNINAGEGDAGWTKTVDKAKILPNGELSQWMPDRPLPQIRSYIMNSTVALNDVVYVIGGTEGDTDGSTPEIKYKTALYAKPDAEDGTLSEWKESAPFPGPAISCFTVSTSPGFIHVIGGRTDSGSLTNNVYTGVVGADGSILQWEIAPPIPERIWFHHSATAGSRVWVWGGLQDQTSDSAMGRVFSAPITGNGRLGLWEESPVQVPVGIYRGANAVAGPYLMSFCTSYAGGRTSSDVVFAGVNGSQINQWQRISTPLPMDNYVSCAPDYRRGRIYIPGGLKTASQTPDRTVAFFQLTGEARRAATGARQTADAADIQSATQDTTGSNRLTYLTQEELPDAALSGFLPYEEARRTLLRSTKPLIVYFHLEGSKPSEEQSSLLRNNSVFSDLTQDAIFAWVDVRESPQVTQSLGVFRSPTWILYNNRGIEQGRSTRQLTAEQLKAGLDAM